MSEGVNASAVSSVDSLTATTTTTTTTTTISTTETTAIKTSLECRDEPELELPEARSSPPPSPPSDDSEETTDNVRKHRKLGTFNCSFLIDGKQIRSALTHKTLPPKGRSVSFPTNDKDLVTGYLEPANPWEHAENVNIEDLISSYKASCERHGSEPLEKLIAQLEKLDISNNERCEELCLKNECLDQYHCEPLEELLKRVQFEKIDVESSSLNDESATILFDMLEYYQSAKHLNMSSNRNIGSRGWQSCAQMIKKTTCLEQFEARDITLTQQHMNILKRPLQLVSHLHVLKLENCGLTGQAFVILVAALKMNTGLKELYLADNCLEEEDAIQLGALLRINNHLQLLDISNNHIKDEGVRDLLDGLVAQSADNRRGKGLSILILWNNDLTRSSSPHFSEAIAQSVTLETLNIGKNSVNNEFLELAQEALIKTRTLMQLGMQSTNLTCKGALLLANVIERNRSLQRIDLRDNNIQMEGLAALSFAMKRNTNITQLDFDDEPWSKTPATVHQYLDLITEIRRYCVRNDESTSTDESTEESGSPQHRSRLSSVSSRKISLTCQTLPRSPPSITPNPMNEMTRSMLEPNRTSGGRLRSPAPSPIPSPVASPIPSPSRGRFVVSRVCETSLSSTNSSASSSPITPPSLTSSPTCFFPNSVGSGSSRFRVVTVVEPTVSNVPLAKSVVTSANSNVTIGFNYKVQTPESVDSDDSDSVFRSDVEEDQRGVTGNESSASIDISLEEDIETGRVVKTDNETVAIIDEEESKNKKITSTLAKENRELGETEYKVPGIIEDNQTDVVIKEEVQSAKNSASTNITSDVMENLVEAEKNEIREPIVELTRVTNSKELEIIETKVNSAKKTEELLHDDIIRCYEPEPKKPEPVQRQPTSLERLLGLFQHPSSLFSSSSYAEKVEIKNPLQDGVNSMLALGDKFHQYLREGRSSGKTGTEDASNHAPLQRSVSDASRSTIKMDPVKSLSIPQLSNIQATCTRDFVPYKDRSKPSGDSWENTETYVESTISRPRKIFVVNESPTDKCPKMVEDKVPRISDDLPLPENVQTDDGNVKIDDTEARNSVTCVVGFENMVSSDRNSSVEIVNNPSSSVFLESKTSICATKLTDIPEYSILEITASCDDERCASDKLSLRNKSVDEEPVNRDADDDDVKTKCDSSTTDSINDPSCKNSSHCKVMCDISGVNNVHTLGNADDVHNFFNSPLSHDDEKRDKDRPMISASTSAPDEPNDAIDNKPLEKAKTIEEINLSRRRGDSNEVAPMNSTTNITLGDLIFNEEEEKSNGRDVIASNEKQGNNVANNVDLSLLPVFNNSCISYINDVRCRNAQQVRVFLTRSDDTAITSTEDIHLTDTIEEFLPLDAAASSTESSVVEEQFATELTNNCINNHSYDDDETTTTTTVTMATMNEEAADLITNEDSEEKNYSRMSDETRLSTAAYEKNLPIEEENALEETITMSERFVIIPNATTSGAGNTRMAIASIEDDDYVQASIEQVSTSLSEDSDYSSKISVDDVRTGELSLNCSTANSPGNETIEHNVAEMSIMNTSLESINIRVNEPSLKSTEHRSFVRAAVESVLTSILSVSDSGTRVTPREEVKSSESTEDLMFKMTDITTDSTTMMNEVTSEIVTTIQVCDDDSGSIVDCYYDGGQSSRSNANLYIEKSMNVHRNSQDSGIEETNVSISDDNVLEANSQPRESFQESVDSGIDSECSSVCARVDVGADVQKERARDPGKSMKTDKSIGDEIAGFSTRLVDIDGILVAQDIARFGDTSGKHEIDGNRSVTTKIADAISVGRSNATTELTNVLTRSTSPE